MAYRTNQWTSMAAKADLRYRMLKAIANHNKMEQLDILLEDIWTIRDLIQYQFVGYSSKGIHLWLTHRGQRAMELYRKE